MTSTTPTHRVEMKATGGSYTPATWRAKYSGRPTDANLATWVEGFEAATQPGGCNAHLGIVTVQYARIVRQRDGQVVALYAAPVAS